MSEIHAKKDAAARRFEVSLDIDAPADAVWSALTQASELTRWFPLEASVTPGEGGSMHWAWGDRWSWGSRITAWEPNRHLRLVETRQGFDADGKQLQRPDANRDLVMDITLETHGGSTRVRLVHSGFGHGADWDDELDGISSGWQYELRSLKHYLEGHRGRDRVAAWVHTSTELPLDAAWDRLFSAGLVQLDAANSTPSAFREGQHFSVTLPGDAQFHGTVVLALPTQFAGFIDELHGGIVRIDAFRGGGRTGLLLWVVSYDEADRPALEALERSAQARLDDAFAVAARLAEIR